MLGGRSVTHKGTGVLVQHVVPPAEGSCQCLSQKVWRREVREALAQVHLGVGSSQFYKLHPGEKGNKSTFRGCEQCAGTRSALSIPLEGGVGVPPAEPSCCSQAGRTQHGSLQTWCS